MPPQTQPVGSNVKASDGTELNPLAVNLARAIRKTESGDDYNAVGDSGDSHGAYQWNKGNFKSFASQYGLDPNDMSPVNQDKVAYSRINDLLKQGRAPSEVAAIWNGAKLVNGKYEAINPSYVDTVKSNYQKEEGLQQAPTAPLASANVGGYQPPTPPGQAPPAQSGNAAGYAPPTPPPTLDTSTSSDSSDQSGGFLQGLGEDLTGTNPESIGTQLANTVKGAGNFLFPIIGDVGNDIAGKNQKTLLQQGGDLALSALPFIPGLGEAGEAARGVELGTEGVGAVAKSGLLGKLAGSTLAKGAATGYGAGVAQNLSQGQDIGTALTPNAANIGGAVLGGAAPSVLKGLGGFATKIAGIDPQIETKLTQLGVEGNPENASLYDKYMAAAKAHATNGEVPAPENIAADNIDQASSKIDQMASQAGKEVGVANKAAASIPIKPGAIPSLVTTLNEGLDSFGVKVGTKANGILALAPTRAGGVPLNAAEQARILDVAQRINDMGNNGNVRMADDLMTVLDKRHDYGATGKDPLTGLFGQVRHAVNETARTASPEFAAANDKLSSLKGIQDTIKTIAGNRLQRGELLMQRMFGKNPGDSQALFSAIKNSTGVDLYKHAVLARHAIESVGSKADKSALQQMIEGSTKGHTGLLGAATSIAQGAAKKTFANPETIGRNLVKGKTGVGKVGGLITKAAARTGASL